MGLLLALGVRTARAETPVGAPPPAPPGATPEAAAPPPAGGSAPTVSVPAPQPPQNQTTLTVGLPQPSVHPINRDIGIGVALTYVSIPLIFISAGVLGVGFIVDSDGAKITGAVMTGTSLALFGVGIGFMVAGSDQGGQAGQAQQSATRGMRSTPPPASKREANSTFVFPVLSGSF